MSEQIKKVETESSEESTQQTPPPQDPPIEEVKTPNPDLIASLEQRIAEQHIQNRRLELLIEESRQARRDNAPPPPPRNIEEERKRFYEDPTGTLDQRDKKILEQMQVMLAPVLEVASSVRGDNEYTRLKTLVKHDPIFGKGLKDPDVEATVDALMRNSGVEINENTIKSAIAQAVGMKNMGGLGGNNRATQSTNETKRIDPPVVPSTNTRIERGASVPKELTEDDRFAMKIAGLKPGNPEHEKEYWALISDETMVLPVHKKKKEG